MKVNSGKQYKVTTSYYHIFCWNELINFAEATSNENSQQSEIGMCNLYSLVTQYIVSLTIQTKQNMIIVFWFLHYCYNTWSIWYDFMKVFRGKVPSRNRHGGTKRFYGVSRGIKMFREVSRGYQEVSRNVKFIKNSQEYHGHQKYERLYQWYQ